MQRTGQKLEAKPKQLASPTSHSESERHVKKNGHNKSTQICFSQIKDIENDDQIVLSPKINIDTEHKNVKGYNKESKYLIVFDE